jgi:DNA-directed RNA polymerase specialized sigma24 family protein
MEELRHSLTLYAYNILGSYEEAKDVVQDVYLKISQVSPDSIHDLKNYMIRMVINLAIDQKRGNRNFAKPIPDSGFRNRSPRKIPSHPFIRKKFCLTRLWCFWKNLTPNNEQYLF